MMLEFRLFLATPFLLVSKVFAFIAELVSGHSVSVHSIAQMISDDDPSLVKMSIHSDLADEFEEAMENLEDDDDIMEVLQDFHDRSVPLFERDDADEGN